MFIQVITGHTSDPAGLKRQLDRWNDELAPGAAGWLGSTAGVTESGDMVGVVRFESAEAARANSDRAEQGEWWAETEKYFDSDVAFHDCSEVEEIWGGGSDEARFVQVIQGHATDAPQFQKLIQMMEATGRHRLDVMGGCFAMHEDGESFTEAFYFTNEEDARRAEAEMNQRIDEVADEMRMFMEVTDNVRYFDLKEPWLSSP